jgi:transposase
LPPSLREWLPEDHLAWFVLDAVDEIDLSGFYGAYRKDGWGRAAFEPQMMVALLLYAYAVGERSSRGIERRCRKDVAFRVLTAYQIPDHPTIARFRARHEQALADTFAQVLALCARAGLVSVGVVALDGSLMAGNASPGATRSYASIRAEVERMLAEAAEADAEDERLGQARGDELPAGLVDARSRRERLRRCKAELEQAQADEEAAYQANLAWRPAWEQEHGRRLTGRKPTPPGPGALAARKINTTDPDTRLMKRAGGKSVQGYNAQVVASPGQVIPRRPSDAIAQRRRPTRSDGRAGRRHAARGRHRRADRDRARRRRLLELARDQRGARARHRRARPHPGPPAQRTTQALTPPGRGSASDRGGALQTRRPSALPSTPADR